MNGTMGGLTARRCDAPGRGPGTVQWRVWAPQAERVGLVLVEGEARHEMPMQPEGGRYHDHVETGVPPGRRYAYRLDGGPMRPDPCSLWRPEGVHGPSAVVLPEQF